MVEGCSLLNFQVLWQAETWVPSDLFALHLYLSGGLDQFLIADLASKDWSGFDYVRRMLYFQGS